MTKWEYKYTSSWGDAIKLGKNGWELVAVLRRDSSSFAEYYLKRPIED